MDTRLGAVAAARFGLGARPGEISKIGADPRGWVKSQLRAQPLPAPIAALPPGEDALLAWSRHNVHQRLQQDASGGFRKTLERNGAAPAQIDAFLRQPAPEPPRIQYFAAANARIAAAAASTTPVYERLVQFWANHFSVSISKARMAGLPPAMEAEAIRPFAVGAFGDLLAAATRHPAMLIYLDNWQNIGPNSPARTRRNARQEPLDGVDEAPTGLNENHARELLELHTLGVKGGYTQADVRALAAILSGWTYERPAPTAVLSGARGTLPAAALFRFASFAHEPGPKTLLGASIADGGEAEGAAALKMLAAHPSTARTIAAKLARHYVADEPPPALVQRLAQRFQATGGDIAATFTALVDAPEAWAAPMTKAKRPEDYLVSVMRALDIAALPNADGARVAAGLGQPVYSAEGPDGFADTAEAWLAPDLLYKRILFASRLAAQFAAKAPPATELADAVLGPLLSQPTKTAIARASSPRQGLTLLFASPEFQYR